MKRIFSRSRLSGLFPLVITLALVSTFVVGSGLFATASRPATTTPKTSAVSTHPHLDCSTNSSYCTDVFDSDQVFGHYVGHDEPAAAFYSDEPGSGNHVRWTMTLPSDPSSANPLTPGKAYNFELHPAFWFGMSMCDTQSYPEQLSTCTPDSDTNAVDPAFSAVKAGQAFLEMQFYPPGFVTWPNGLSCDGTSWCAALNI